MAKRRRQDDVPEDDPWNGDTALAASAAPLEKFSRLVPIDVTAGGDPDGAELTCTLPPLCNLRPRKFFDVTAFESHYQKYHCNICNECLARFPTNIFLDLHLEECHDPIWSARLARGEKTYRCFVEHCTVRFGSATSRRRHLEAVHQYPPEFRFNIVTKGLDKNAKSLLYDQRVRSTIRKNIQVSWNHDDGLMDEDDSKKERTSSEVQQSRPPLTRAQRRAAAREHQPIVEQGGTRPDQEQSKEYEDDMTKQGNTAKGRDADVKKKQDAKELHKQSVHDLFKGLDEPDMLEPTEQDNADTQMDDLTKVLDRAQFVPANIRFGNRHAR